MRPLRHNDAHCLRLRSARTRNSRGTPSSALPASAGTHHSPLPCAHSSEEKTRCSRSVAAGSAIENASCACGCCCRSSGTRACSHPHEACPSTRSKPFCGRILRGHWSDSSRHRVGHPATAAFEFPPRRPDQALLGWRRGQVKNKSNDPAALIHPRDRWMLRNQSNIGFKLLKNKELFLVPGRGLEPPRSYPLVPETSASTNSATRAGRSECPLRARAIYAGGRELSIESA
jgi:hypothetical protein